MDVRHFCKWCVVSTLLALGSSFGLDTTLYAQVGQAGAAQGMQVLTRGPVHEAFAETVTFDPEPGIVAPKAPPAAIEELPPDQKPEGVNVAWIPGYWGWDDERSDFLWVSGVWRVLPPGRQWVPGYWGRSAQGVQWTSGYWADAQASEVEYLPEPPATVEAGPNIAASSADQTWLPGCWIWQQNRYAWRPGFWANVEPDWDWVPAHYVWAPRGYVFVDGYWDYSIGRRGVLFAPVYFDQGVYTRPGFSYSPTTVIDLGAFASHLFLRPRYQHYYFGDYYDTNYRNAGFHPWFSINTGRFGYDPIYAHQRWQHRQDSEWEHRQKADFENRRDHTNLRPPRTWANQGEIGRGDVASFVQNIVGVSLDQASPSRNDAWQFQPIDQAERQRLHQHGQEVYRFRDQRQQWETNAAEAPADTRRKDFASGRAPLPRSPIVAQAEQIGNNQAPPKTYQAPALDLKVEARPRENRSQGQPRSHTASQPLDTQRQPDMQQPRVDQPAQPPRVEQSAPQSQPQSKMDRPTPAQRSEWSASRRQSPNVDRPASAARDSMRVRSSSMGPKQDRGKSKD